MVAIAFVLAAIVGTFVLGAQVQETAPNAQFNASLKGSATDDPTFTHEGRDSIDADRPNFVGQGLDDIENVDETNFGSDCLSAESSAVIDAENLTALVARFDSSGSSKKGARDPCSEPTTYRTTARVSDRFRRLSTGRHATEVPTS